MIEIILFIVIIWIFLQLFDSPVVNPQYTPPVPRQQQQVPQSRFSPSTRQHYASNQPWAYHIPQYEDQFEDQYEDPSLTAAIFKKADTCNWSIKSLSALRIASSQHRYSLNTLHEGSTDHQKVSRSFKRTAQKQLKIHKIQRVENPYLFGCYILKREELSCKFYRPEEVNYFHGTKSKNVTSICSNNFNWRLHGDSRGYRYGKGVSFSPIANYSSHYCDNKPNCENVMFLARVLVTDSILGSKGMIIPPHGYDTAKKEDGHVVVKFCDSEFYPEYVIHFTGSATKSVIKTC